MSTTPKIDRTTHTPGPWHIDRMAAGPSFYVIDEAGEDIARVRGGDDRSHPNAEFIVRACNSHEELLEVVRMVANASMCGTKSEPPESWIGWQWSGGGTEAAYRIKELARAALAKAEGR